MCGFLGEISSQLLSQTTFKSLLDLSIRRGPDQQGFWKDSLCQIGFNRLAILDLTENGNQPLLSPSGRYAMVFNGEVYNYKELQLKYCIEDSSLRSGSDAEVLSHLLDQLPIAIFVKELNGMFAISVWDLETQKLYLIRDFAGIKPLFYGLHTDGIIFASQFDQVFQHPYFKDKKLRPEIMKEYFGLGYMHAPNTVFENIFQIEAGHIMEWDYKSKTIISDINYFPWDFSSKIKETSSEAVRQFSEQFDSVIKNQLQADVPVASFLSSGIDSTLVTAYAKKYKSDLKAFTFGIDDPELNEAAAAAEYAKILKVDHVVETSNSADLLQIIEEHFVAMPEPFGDYSSIPTYLITQRAKEYATVMLAGDGGDELFWGYPRFIKSVQQAQWFCLPFFLRRIVMPFIRKINKSLSYGIDAEHTFSNWILHNQLHYTNLNSLFKKYSFSKELYKSYELQGSLSKVNVLNYLKKNEFAAHQQRTLKKVDLMSMGNSLEVRVPFLDRQIVNFSNRIHPQLGVKHFIPKLILKADLVCYIPERLVNHKKKGFTVPIEKWLKNELKADFIKTVLEQPIFGNEFVEEEFLHNQIKGFFNEKQNVNAWGLWHLYAWQKWAINNKLNLNEK